MSSNNPVQNIKNYISGSHKFINMGTGSSSMPTNTLVTLEKRTVMTIQSCNIGIGTTIPRTNLDIIGNSYVSQNIGIGTTIIGPYGLNIIGNVSSSATVTATNYIAESATLSGTLITSNLTILGSNTVINTYTQQSSNFSICNITGTGPALSVLQKGAGSSYPIADFYDIDISTTVPSLRIADAGNIGIGTTIPVMALHVQGSIFSSANIGIGTIIPRQVLDIIGDIITTGNIGIGITLPSARLQVGAGTTTIAPVQFTSGTNLTTASAGAIEYDGVKFYGTTDTTSGRGYIPSNQIFRLTVDGSAIGSGISNFFGVNSAINLIAGGIYKLEAYCYFLSTSTGTVRVTLTTSQAAEFVNGFIHWGSSGSANITNCIPVYKLTGGTANAFAVSGSLSSGSSYAFVIYAIIEASLTDNSTLTINFTESSGTITPQQSSYYKITRLPTTNIGVFT
jgi:hypothetical protein